jgi:hypothetical protein
MLCVIHIEYVLYSPIPRGRSVRRVFEKNSSKKRMCLSCLDMMKCLAEEGVNNGVVGMSCAFLFAMYL